MDGAAKVSTLALSIFGNSGYLLSAGVLVFVGLSTDGFRGTLVSLRGAFDALEVGLKILCVAGRRFRRGVRRREYLALGGLRGFKLSLASGTGSSFARDTVTLRYEADRSFIECFSYLQRLPRRLGRALGVTRVSSDGALLRTVRGTRGSRRGMTRLGGICGSTAKHSGEASTLARSINLVTKTRFLEGSSG